MLLGTISFCLASANPAAIEEDTSNSLVKKWLQEKITFGESQDKGASYDFYTTKDFIESSKKIGAFPSVGSELSVLQQISKGEYDSELIARGTEYANRIIDEFEKRSHKIVDVVDKAYSPEEEVQSSIPLEKKK